jgi:hypothetical protein
MFRCYWGHTVIRLIEGARPSRNMMRWLMRNTLGNDKALGHVLKVNGFHFILGILGSFHLHIESINMHLFAQTQ